MNDTHAPHAGPRPRARRPRESGGVFLVLGVMVLCMVAVRPARSVTVDLNGDLTNESNVDVTVKSVYPVRIQNKVTNRVVDQSYTFDWHTAGPGGFAERAGPGSTTGAGVIWTWETTRQVYSLSCSVTDSNRPCMDLDAVPNDADTPATDLETINTIPGRTLQPSSVTSTTESLRSSLLSFFSPPKELVRVTSEVQQLTNGQFQYRTRVLNLSDHAITFDLASGPLGCDFACDAGLTNCGGTCVNLLDDEFNCGSCGKACSAGEFCAGGTCVTIPALTIFPGTGLEANSAAPSPQQGESCEFLPSDGPIVFALPLAIGSGSVENSVPSVPAPAGASGTLQPLEDRVVECRLSSFPAKEVSSQLTVCGHDVPRGRTECSDTALGARGMVNVFVPDPSQPIGDAFLSPLEVRVRDESGDGIPQPGERFDLFVTLTNSGPATVRDVHARLIAPEVDLDADDQDGDLAPDPIVIDQASATYPEIRGVATETGSPMCGSGTPLAPTPATNATPFTLFVPADHPRDTARQMSLEITGQTGGTTEAAFSATVDFVLSVGSRCEGGAAGGFDRLEGLLQPLAALVLEGDSVPMPERGFRLGSTLPLRLRAFCGETPLVGPSSEAPRIVALARGGTPVDLATINPDAGKANNNSVLFRSDGRRGLWGYELTTRNLQPGEHVITIQMPNGQNYTAGFVLK